MSVLTAAALRQPPARRRSMAPALFERNVRVYRRSWLMLVSGFLEPLLYLFALGVGLGAVIKGVTGPDGQPLTYAAFVAPAMLATSAMNGAVIDVTFNVFFKLRYNKLYDAVLATPVSPRDVAAGEIAWAVTRGSLYSSAFLVVMVALGLVSSWWALLVPAAALLLGFAFAGIGMAVTTFMKSWQDFEWTFLATLPMFLLSGTFYPLSVYPPALRVVVQCTPLYQGVDLVRSLSVGAVHPVLLLRVAYLVVLGGIGLLITSRRLARLLLR